MWRLATSLPYRRTAGPNTGLRASLYVLGIGQTKHVTDDSGSVDTLGGDLHREHHFE